MTLLEYLNQAIVQLQAFNTSPTIKRFIFVLQDIQKTLSDPNYLPHLNYDRSRGEGCYTALGYHAFFGGFNALQSDKEELPAYEIFSHFISLYHELYNYSNLPLKAYDDLLQGYQKNVLNNPLNELRYAKWCETGKVTLREMTGLVIQKLNQYHTPLSQWWRAILTQFFNHLSDSRNALDYQEIYQLLGYDEWSQRYQIPLPLSKDDLAPILIFDDYIKALKCDYPNTDDTQDYYWGEMNQFINLLVHYQNHVLNDSPTGEIGLLTQSQDPHYIIPENDSLLTDITDTTRALRSAVGNAANKWVQERDDSRRKKQRESNEESGLLGLLLCCLNPFIGACFFCCNAYLSEAELERAKREDEATVQNNLAFLTDLEIGINQRTLSYRDLPIIDSKLETFKTFSLSLPEIQKVHSRFGIMVEWLYSCLNKYFGARIESNRTKTINDTLTFWSELQPECKQRQQQVSDELNTVKDQVLERRSRSL